MAINLLCSNNDREVAHSSVSNTPLHERDPAISGEDNIHSIVSDTSLGGVTTKHTDTQQDHTYNAAEFHRQTHNNELPGYNTLQHGNAANTQIDNNSVLGTYNKIDIITRKDPQKCSKVSKQLQRNTHTTDAIHIYDDVETDWTNKTTPADYEPVYHESNYRHVNKPTGEYVLFDDETYGTHKPASKGAAVKLGVDRIESTHHSETTAAVKEETSTSDKEVEYAEPLPSNVNSGHTSNAQAKDEHFYHSLEDNKPEKCVGGVPYSKESSNSVMKASTLASNSDYFHEVELSGLAPNDEVTADAKCQTQILTSLYNSAHAMDEVGAMLNAPILFNIDQCEFDDPMYEGIPHSVPQQMDKNPSLSLEEKTQTMHLLQEEASCIGDVNDDPELLNHEEDINVPKYSDPVVPGRLDDINIMATDQRDSTVNIYNTFDDPTL